MTNEFTYDNRNVNKFVSILEERGFIVQEGELKYLDVLKLVSEGILDNAMGNHAGAPYSPVLLPPAPNQHPAPGQKPPIGYNPDDPGNYAPNLTYAAPGFTYKLRPDEAVVLIGLTPPQAVYFGFRSYLAFVENKPGKDYSGAITAGDASTGFYHGVFGSLGDQINNFNIWTENTPRGSAGNPFNSSTILISTADQNVNKQIRDALLGADFDPGTMNNDNIPLGLVNMGLEKGKDTFSFLMRAAIWSEKIIGDQYLNNLDHYVKVYRITPKTPYTSLSPWPIPELKIKETGTTEFQILPSARFELDYLRYQILAKYGSEEFEHVYLNFTLTIVEGFEAILNDVNVWADNRDAIYISSDHFTLKSDDDFIILYGVNHEQTGKAVFSNASFYGAEYFNGVAVANTTVEFKDSAAEYFPEGYINQKFYYVCKMSRKISQEEIEIIVPYSTGNPNGKAFGVDNNQESYLIFRIYVDQETLVGPALFDVIWDHAILFTKKANRVKAASNDIIIKVGSTETRL
ncbi:hypothetical protein [Paenibacillus caseinilyticus]|nr:hypothetical protein [Paenibacillus caseinilyticus]MCZ8521893.1 hypothetical protein [Paenibacillus caseinilyticus]